MYGQPLHPTRLMPTLSAQAFIPSGLFSRRASCEVRPRENLRNETGSSVSFIHSGAGGVRPIASINAPGNSGCAEPKLAVVAHTSAPLCAAVYCGAAAMPPL